MTPSPLAINGLSFVYPPAGGAPPIADAPWLLGGLSFEVRAGETGVILGGADRGKTTLARILCGLVPRFTGGVVEGEARIGDTDILASPPWALLESVGLVFQDSEAQLFTTRCDTEVAFALESLGIPRDGIARRIGESLGLVGLGGMHARNPLSLSGGEKKRLLAACLLAIDPSAWVLDESLEEMDEGWRAALLDILRARGPTTLILDSRWSKTLAGIRGSFGVLTAGRIAAGCAPHPSPDLRSALAEEGLGHDGPLPPLELPRGARAPFLKAEGIRFSFAGEEGFTLSVESLEIERGTITALVGPNGSGKSTLARVLCGLARPSAGAILLSDGRGWRLATRDELTRRVGYLFQNPDHQIYLPTVAEELALGLRNRGLGRSRVEALVEEAIARFGLPGPGAAPALMSYGMRRRLQAAVYWLLDRDLLILDEMDMGLSQRDLASVMRELCCRAGCLVLITHDADFARAAADRIVSLRDGTVAGDRGPGDGS